MKKEDLNPVQKIIAAIVNDEAIQYSFKDDFFAIVWYEGVDGVKMTTEAYYIKDETDENNDWFDSTIAHYEFPDGKKKNEITYVKVPQAFVDEFLNEKENEG